MIETTAVLSSKLQLTLPESMAHALHLRPGSGVILRLEAGRLVLVPLVAGGLTELFGGCLQGAYGDVDAYLKQERRPWGER
jgi:hypothetical protein